MDKEPIKPEQGILPNVDEDPDIMTLRSAISDFISERLPEPNTVTHVTDIEGIKHRIYGNDIIIEQVEGEPKANIKNKATMALIGAGFTLGALMIAISVAKFYNRKPKE